MGFTEITIKLPTDCNEKMIKSEIRNTLELNVFSYHILSKSLDARKKNNIHWLIRVAVFSDALPGSVPGSVESAPTLEIPHRNRQSEAVVVGSGPAGFFAALVLQLAGYSTTIVERGCEVKKRAHGIKRFENGGPFDPKANYAFGEGGAGTFSDGKLTARTKKIELEKRFILRKYIEAGAPPEIEYLAHPHLGTDNLRHIVVNLRQEFEQLGGTILFETELLDLVLSGKTVTGAITSDGDLGADVLLIAPGHSAYETYRMLMSHGVLFRTKNFAIGCRVEHPQELINRAQWGCASLPGVKAAEYRLTTKVDGGLPVFTFCMCPGGMVVPATAYSERNIVNGMSRYRRDGRFANAACVAGINLSTLFSREVEPLEALDWLDSLEYDFFRFGNGYQAPGTKISDFIRKKTTSTAMESSYPLGLSPAPLWEMLPQQVAESLASGLVSFSRKLKGFDTGLILGLESKTSAPLQSVRDESRRCQGFSNLYMAGEGSGWSGGIISSGVDGIRTALAILENEQ